MYQLPVGVDINLSKYFIRATMESILSELCLTTFPPFVFRPGFEFGVGGGSGRHQENAERHATCRERQSGQRQVQNPTADPPGQHQAAYR